jgi:carbon storage regulator
MLVLSRKPGESLRIGDEIRLVIVRIDRDRVRVGIEAPAEVRIARGELDLLLSRAAGEAGTAVTTASGP